MNKQILMKHIKDFLEDLKNSPEKFKEDIKERLELTEYYQGYTRDKIIRMTEEDIYQYISKLWAMWWQRSESEPNQRSVSEPPQVVV